MAKASRGGKGGNAHEQGHRECRQAEACAPGKALQRGPAAAEASGTDTAAESAWELSLGRGGGRTGEGAGAAPCPPWDPLGRDPRQGKQWQPTALHWPVETPWPLEPCPAPGVALIPWAPAV